ncbi:MAG: 4-hydroxy-tetrahydrodipicolinate synthase [Oscillospiraceae bacterium]|nr:4-hydroxy-tetrahydrodipicolinate synthase [Oscillospiraceae bacterium]
MVKTPVFKGSCTAIVTPFHEHGVDYDRLKRNLDFQFENGTAAVVVCGTTGEAATLTPEEHNELVRVTRRQTLGKLKLIVGVGSNNTLSALRAAENAKSAGADAILMVTPYYNKTSQKGLVEHFSYVADRVDIPMILYNVPSRTGIGLSVDSCKQLSEHPNIVGIKEASGDIAFAGKVRSTCGDDLYLWSGNDDCTVPLMSLGALGVISVASNIVPGVVAKLCDLCLNESFAEATELYGKYAALMAALFIETNPIPVKAAMKAMSLDSGILRLPLTEIGQDNRAKLLSVMREIGLNV